MAWTDYFVEHLPGAKVTVTPNGRPLISMPVDFDEIIEINLTESENELPFKVTFKRLDKLGAILEERDFGYAGTRDLAVTMAIGLSSLRTNSKEFVLDGE